MVDFKNFVNCFVKKTQDVIIELENIKGLSNEQKKIFLDDKIKEFALPCIATLPFPLWLKITLKFVINKYIGVITQVIFDLLKTKIQGFTKEGE